MQENKHLHEKETSHRHLKVVWGFRQDRNGNDVPLVQLTGAWMQTAG